MKKLRVLLVDDEIMIREGFKRLFDWEAHDCEVAGEAGDLDNSAITASRCFNSSACEAFSASISARISAISSAGVFVSVDSCSFGMFFILF